MVEERNQRMVCERNEPLVKVKGFVGHIAVMQLGLDKPKSIIYFLKLKGLICYF